MGAKETNWKIKCVIVNTLSIKAFEKLESLLNWEKNYKSINSSKFSLKVCTLCAELYACVRERKGKRVWLGIFDPVETFQAQKRASWGRERKRERGGEECTRSASSPSMNHSYLCPLLWRKRNPQTKTLWMFCCYHDKGSWKYFTCDHLWENVDHEQGFPLHKKNPLEPKPSIWKVEVKSRYIFPTE